MESALFTFETREGAYHAVQDLMWYDGPLAALFCDDAGARFLGIVVERGMREVWFLAPLTSEREQTVLSGALSVREAILQAEGGAVHVLLHDGSSQIWQREIRAVKELDPGILPDPDCRLGVSRDPGRRSG